MRIPQCFQVILYSIARLINIAHWVGSVLLLTPCDMGTPWAWGGVHNLVARLGGAKGPASDPLGQSMLHCHTLPTPLSTANMAGALPTPPGLTSRVCSCVGGYPAQPPVCLGEVWTSGWGY